MITIIIILIILAVPIWLGLRWANNNRRINVSKRKFDETMKEAKKYYDRVCKLSDKGYTEINTMRDAFDGSEIGIFFSYPTEVSQNNFVNKWNSIVDKFKESIQRLESLDKLLITANGLLASDVNTDLNLMGTIDGVVFCDKNALLTDLNNVLENRCDQINKLKYLIDNKEFNNLQGQIDRVVSCNKNYDKIVTEIKKTIGEDAEKITMGKNANEIKRSLLDSLSSTIALKNLRQSTLYNLNDTICELDKISIISDPRNNSEIISNYNIVSKYKKTCQELTSAANSEARIGAFNNKPTPPRASNYNTFINDRNAVRDKLQQSRNTRNGYFNIIDEDDDVTIPIIADIIEDVVDTQIFFDDDNSYDDDF